jgi:integrase
VQNFGDRPYPVLQWYDPVTGKRKSKSAESCNPIDVERRRAALEYELNHGLYREASNMPWERFRQLFEDEHVAAKRPETRRNYRGTLDQFEQICRPRTLAGVNERTVSAFAAGLRSRPGRGGGQKASTVKVRLQYLHGCLRWAERQKLIPECPTFPSIKVPRQRPRPTPVESFERLLEKAPDAQWRAFFLSGWLAGLRLGEAMALEWDESDSAPWLDPARGRVWLPAAFVKAVEDQWVPLDPRLWEALDALPRHGKKVFRILGVHGRPLSQKVVSKKAAALARRAGVRLTMKELRKGFGCHYAGKVPAQVLQKLMRHASIRTTMEYYANVDDAVMEAVLGDRRNSLRNSGAERTGDVQERLSATP